MNQIESKGLNKISQWLKDVTRLSRSQLEMGSLVKIQRTRKAKKNFLRFFS